MATLFNIDIYKMANDKVEIQLMGKLDDSIKDEMKSEGATIKVDTKNKDISIVGASDELIGKIRRQLGLD